MIPNEVLVKSLTEAPAPADPREVEIIGGGGALSAPAEFWRAWKLGRPCSSTATTSPSRTTSKGKPWSAVATIRNRAFWDLPFRETRLTRPRRTFASER